MGDVDHREAELLVQEFELRAQLPLELRVDDGQRFVEEDGVDVLADQAATERYLLLGVGGEVLGLGLQLLFQAEHLRQFDDPRLDLFFRSAPVFQGKGEVLKHRHGVVDHRKLENLGDVALLGGQPGDVLVVEQDLALGRDQEPGNDVQ